MAQINIMWVEERQQWIRQFVARAHTVAPLLPGCECGGKWKTSVNGDTIAVSVVTTHGRLSVQVPFLHCAACAARQKISPVYLGCFPMNPTAMSPHSGSVCVPPCQPRFLKKYTVLSVCIDTSSVWRKCEVWQLLRRSWPV